MNLQNFWSYQDATKAILETIAKFHYQEPKHIRDIFVEWITEQLKFGLEIRD